MHLQAIKRILVIAHSMIGDVLLATPMVRTLKRAYPGSHLTCIVKGRPKDVLANNPDIDCLMFYDADIIRRVTMQPAYDLAINFEDTGVVPLPKLGSTHAICLLSGAQYRVGWSLYHDIRIGQLNVYNVFADRDDNCEDEEGDAIDFYLRFTRALGLKDAGRETKLVLTPEEQDFAASFWADCGLTRATPVVGLHPGGRGPKRLWAAQHYAQAADELMADSGCRILVFQGPGEAEIAQSVCQAMQHQALLVPLLEIRKYAALVKKCHLFISTDGGPIHIAAAVGSKVLGIFRHKVTSDYWFPYRDRPGCLLLLESDSRRITVREVVTAARQLLRG